MAKNSNFFTSLFTNGVIWFGVAISVSEIEAGIEIGAASDWNSLWLPLILGHVLGGFLLFFVGLIGAKVRQNAMETTSLVYGKYGSKFFASLNVFQLVAWVAVLNSQGASVLAGLHLPISFSLTCVLLAVLIALWVFIGLRRFANVTTFVMAVLTILLIVLTVKLFGVDSNLSAPAAQHAFTFWNIFEISIAMPLSWLPVISDYTKDVEKPVQATTVSAVAYSVASFWMYFIGVQIAGAGVENDIARAIAVAGLGVPGIIIVVLSTVTTNFLAANSAGESSKAIYSRLNPKIVGVIVSGVSAVLAISGIMDHYIDFLYFIASVFAPMAAVLLVSFYFANGRENGRGFWIWNLFAWLVGFVVYQVTARLESVFLGPTLLSIIASAVLAFVRIKVKVK